MTTFALKFEVESSTELADLETIFYEHFEGLAAESFGRLLLTVYMDGHDNGTIAAKCAAMEIQDRLGVSVCRMDRDLVDASEIARRIERSRESVRQLIQGERHRGTPFPTPIGAPNGKRIWEWGVVNEWLRTSVPGVGDPERYLSRDEMAAVDGWLLRWSTLPRDQHVRSEFYELTASVSLHKGSQDRSRQASEAWVSSWNVRKCEVRTESVSLPTTG